MENICKLILEEIKNHQKIILIRHANPDYDAYGSQFGLYYSLKQAFTDKTILLDGDDNSSNFYNRKMDDVSDEDYKDALVILLDQSSLNMLRDERFRLGDKLIIIDHHEKNPDFGDIVLIKPEYSSASELVTEILHKLKLPLPKESADALYIGMVGDSGRFFYKGTSANTFKMAALLIEDGADIQTDYKLMTREETENQKRIKGYVLSNFVIDKKVAYIYISKEARNKYGVDPFNASRGTVNLLSGLEGVEAFLNFTEADTGEIFSEFRSKTIPIVDVSIEFGGGGHELACGATLKSKDDVKVFVDRLNEYLGE